MIVYSFQLFSDIFRVPLSIVLLLLEALAISLFVAEFICLMNEVGGVLSFSSKKKKRKDICASLGKLGNKGLG